MAGTDAVWKTASTCIRSLCCTPPARAPHRDPQQPCTTAVLGLVTACNCKRGQGTCIYACLKGLGRRVAGWVSHRDLAWSWLSMRRTHLDSTLCRAVRSKQVAWRSREKSGTKRSRLKTTAMRRWNLYHPCRQDRCQEACCCPTGHECRCRRVRRLPWRPNLR